jgi:hypothetical protein
MFRRSPFCVERIAVRGCIVNRTSDVPGHTPALRCRRRELGVPRHAVSTSATTGSRLFAPRGCEESVYAPFWR